jgi:uncharacterized protein (DUF2236 family)
VAVAPSRPQHAWPDPSPAERLVSGAGDIIGTIGRVASFGLPGFITRRALLALGWTAPAVDPDDPPWCPPEGVSWRIHGDPAALIGGFLSLWIQALHPLALAGVMEHSGFRADPLGRLNATAGFVTATTFCPGSRAGALCANVRVVHRRIHGVAPDGRQYSAEDPVLLDWVHCALLLAVARCWLHYGDHPDPSCLDEYVREQARVPIELGDPDPPMSWGALLDRLEAHRERLAVNAQTRWMGAWLERPALPRLARFGASAYRHLLFEPAVAAAPDWVVKLWGGTQPGRAVTLRARCVCSLTSALCGPRSTHPSRPRAAYG